MELQITFPGGKRVDAHFMGQTVYTDQSRAAGGEGSAPEPYMHFLASIGTCAGIYVLGFCQARGIPTEGIELTQRMEFDRPTHRLARVEVEIRTPPSFPDKYLPAIRRAADLCAVKKAILDPPEFEVTAVKSAETSTARAAG
jgi:ribosomal protein S12 methylthiotransferase accessory factor